VAVGALALYGSLPRVRAARILARTSLAPLPDSAEQIRVYTASGPDQADAYVRFGAEPNDVERFLSESPALRDAKCEAVTSEEAGLKPLPESLFGGPAWYKGDVTGRTWRCRSIREAQSETLTVTVDDDDTNVYVAAQRRYGGKDE
jgi:hypothetical protein